MIDTAATMARALTALASAFVRSVAAVPAQTVELTRRTHAVILAGPVPTVTPSAPPGSANIMKIIGWVGWGVFAAAIAGVLFICIKMATSAHKTRMGDGGGEEAGKLFWPLLACIVGSSAGAILGAVS